MKTKEMTLGTVATYINGRAFKPSEWESKGLPIIRIQNLTDSSVSYNYSQATYEEKYLVKNGDLLFAWSASLGAHIWKREDAWLNQHIFKVIPNDGIDKMYLFYFLQKITAELYAKAHGTGMVHITKAPFMSTPIQVPSIEKQKEIVTHIEELFSQLDSGMETLKKTKQQLEVYRQAVLKEVFGSVSQTIPFGEITNARLGKMLDKEKNIGVPKPYLRNINVRWFSFDMADMLEMPFEKKETEKYSIAKGDLVICEGGEPGRCAVWESEDNVYYQKALHRVRFIDDSNPYFYMYYLWHAAKSGKLSPYYTGTGIKHLTGQSLARLPVPSIERSKQDAVVEYVEMQITKSNRIETTIDETMSQAEAMKQSILKQAFAERKKSCKS